jgi:hypothetical protein
MLGSINAGRNACVAVILGVLRGWDRALTRTRVRRYAAIALTVGLLAYVAAIARGQLPFDAYGHPLAVDLTAHITGARILLAGRPSHLYDVSYQWAVEQQLLGGQEPHFLDLFISPPIAAYLYVPFAPLPYVTAAATWTLVSLLALAASLALLRPLVPGRRPSDFGLTLLIVASSWPTIELLTDGQDSALSLLLLVAAWRLLRAKRDSLAGAVVGLGAFKPQLFLLLPVLFLVERRWRALATWALVTLALLAASLQTVGIGGVRAYVKLLNSALFQQSMASLTWKTLSFTQLLQASLPASATLAVSIVAVAVGATGVTVAARQFRQESDRSFDRLYAVTILLMVALDPHFIFYDGVLLVLPALLLWSTEAQNALLRLTLSALYLLTWTAGLREAAFSTAAWPISWLAAPWGALAVIPLLFIARPFIAVPGPPPALGHREPQYAPPDGLQYAIQRGHPAHLEV